MSNKNILLGTVGYQLLSNHSIGLLLLDQLKEQSWPVAIDIQELNWGPIAIVQNFQAAKQPYDRIVLFSAIERNGRTIGDYTIFRWGGEIPHDKEVQARIGEAVTGVISAENLLIIGEYFDIWPEEVYLFDVEPGPEKPGTVLSIELKQRSSEYIRQLQNLCLNGMHSCDKVNILYGDEIRVSP